jgi:hypothetical protein
MQLDLNIVLQFQKRYQYTDNHFKQKGNIKLYDLSEEIVNHSPSTLLCLCTDVNYNQFRLKHAKQILHSQKKECRVWVKSKRLY